MALFNQILLGLAILAVLVVGGINAEEGEVTHFGDGGEGGMATSGANPISGYMSFMAMLVIPMLHVMLRKINVL